MDSLITISTKPAADGRIAGTAIVQKRKDVRGCVNNKMADTLFDLLEANGRWDEFGAFCRDLGRPDLSAHRDYKAALVIEVDVKCAEMPVMARVLSGDATTCELLELSGKLDADLAAILLAKESVQAEIDARRLGIAS